MSSLKNTSFFFVPFTFGDRNKFKQLVTELKKNKMWSPVKNNNKYMQKYVSSKFDSDNEKDCQCFHFSLMDSSRKEAGLDDRNKFYHTGTAPDKEPQEPIRFKIESVQLFCFSTTIGIIVFELSFDDNDLIKISDNQYYLKKVSKEIIYTADGKKAFSILDIAGNLMKPFSEKFDFEFFFYLNESNERANVFTYIESEPQDSFDKELFYLKRCYSVGYKYTENDNSFNNEGTYIPSQDIIWGISPEAAVCIAAPDSDDRKNFIHKTFYDNFCKQYLFMYVFLLHQKYMLYLFMTRIGIGMYNDLEKLEEYQQQLYEFETDFVYSCVSEIPQYQNLYERIYDSFRIEKMFKDVYEPLTSLGENRKQKAENEQKKRDKNVDRALFFLSLLSFFSALVDSFDFTKSFFSPFIGEKGIAIIQYIFIGIIVIITVRVLVTYTIKNHRK